LAFSRDQEKKIYVQHCMMEFAEGIWNLLEKKGACIYICGDARAMAKDVHSAFRQIIVSIGQKTEEESEEYLKQLQSTNRYLTDVWF